MLVPLGCSSSCFSPLVSTAPGILPQSPRDEDSLISPLHLLQKCTPGGLSYQLFMPLCEWKSILKSTGVRHFLKVFALPVDLSVFFVCILALRGCLKNSQEHYVLNVTHSYDIIGPKCLGFSAFWIPSHAYLFSPLSHLDPATQNSFFPPSSQPELFPT